MAARYYDDAVRNGLGEAQAEEWRRNVDDWLRALVNVIETSGGATGNRKGLKVTFSGANMI